MSASKHQTIYIKSLTKKNVLYEYTSVNELPFFSTVSRTLAEVETNAYLLPQELGLTCLLALIKCASNSRFYSSDSDLSSMHPDYCKS